MRFPYAIGALLSALVLTGLTQPTQADHNFDPIVIRYDATAFEDVDANNVELNNDTIDAWSEDDLITRNWFWNFPDGPGAMTMVEHMGVQALQMDTLSAGTPGESKFGTAFEGHNEAIWQDGFVVRTTFAMPDRADLNPRKDDWAAYGRRAMMITPGNLGDAQFRMTFGTDGNGDPIVDMALPSTHRDTVTLFDPAQHSHTIVGGAGQWHTYQLVKEAGTHNTADLYVDGQMNFTLARNCQPKSIASAAHCDPVGILLISNQKRLSPPTAPP